MFLTKLKSVTAALVLVTVLACTLFLAGGHVGWFLSAQEPPAAAPQVRSDIAGDALPAGAVARLGVNRFRHTGWHPGITISPDSKILVTTTESGQNVRFWDISNGKLLNERHDENSRYSSVVYSPDGKSLVTVRTTWETPQKHTAALVFWDSQGRKAQRTFPLAGEAPTRLHFTPDGKFLIGAAKGQMVVLEADTGKELLRYGLVKRDVSALALSPDGRLVAAADEYASDVKVWDWQAVAEPRSFPSQSDRGCTTLAFSPDGKTLFGRGSYNGDDGLLIWDVASGKLVKQWIGHHSLDYADNLTIHPDGKLVAVVRAANRTFDKGAGGVYLWNIDTGKLEKSFRTYGNGIRACLFSPDKRWLAARSERGANVWDLRTGREVAAYEEAHDGDIWTLALSSQQVLATASDDTTIGLWDVHGKLLRKLKQTERANGLAFSPDGSLLLAAGTADTVDLWEVKTGIKRYSLPGHGRYGGLRIVTFAPDGSHFFSFGDDYFFRRYRTANGKALFEKRLIPKGMDAKLLLNPDAIRGMREELMLAGGAEFTHDGRILVITYGQSVHLFDTATGAVTRDFAIDYHLRRHEFCLSPDGRWLLAAGSHAPSKIDLTKADAEPESSVTIWELATGKQIRRTRLAEKYPSRVAFSEDGKYYAVVCNYAKPKPRIRFWESTTGREVHVLNGLPGSVRALTFSLDHRQLYTSMDDTSVLVWDLPMP
jgi:WD40 repeat protein